MRVVVFERVRNDVSDGRPLEGENRRIGESKVQSDPGTTGSDERLDDPDDASTLECRVTSVETRAHKSQQSRTHGVCTRRDG